MVPVSHIILHLGLCQSVARLSSESAIAIRVKVSDRTGQVVADKAFRVERGDDPERVVEFDIPWGVYRFDSSVAKYGCNASDFVQLLPEVNRQVTQTLADGAPPPTMPMLLAGNAPQSFLYVKPTFVVFDKSAAICNKPIPDPLPSNVVVQNDQDAFYAMLFPASLPGGTVPLLAMRLKTPTHQYHYVRIPIPIPTHWGGWPPSIQFPVTQDMVDGLASDPVDTLLCPKLWETSSG